MTARVLARAPGRLRPALRALTLALALVLLAHPLASAGSDVFANVGPASQLPAGGLSDRYPLGNYALDQHFDAVEASLTGGVDVSGVPPMIAHFLANTLWQLTAFLANALITLFTFAFSLDLVRGSEATGGAGALEPVGAAIRSIYSDVFGAPWLAVAIAVVGLWAIWRALVQRRYTETAGALGVSLVYLIIALAFVTQPERTIGQASRWTNEMSAAFLSLSDRGTISGEDEAKQAAADQLFSVLIYDPWAVLQFGGLEHCARDGTGSEDSDPVSVRVRPLSQDPSEDARLSRRLQGGTQVQADGKACINNRNKYAPHFLRFSPGSDERNAEYEALNSGDASDLPDADPSKQSGDYPLGIADKPATDAIEKGGQYQRLLMALVVFAGELGAFLLLGALSIGVILAQVLLLLLLAFAPVALVIGVIPGRGHDFFRGWLTRLAAFLLRKAAYSLILAVLLAVAAALADATSNLGWLLSFGLQAVFFWAVFLYRHQLTDRLLAATTGTGHRLEGAAAGLASVYLGTRLAERPLRGLRRRLHPRGASRGAAAPAGERATAPAPGELGQRDGKGEGPGEDELGRPPRTPSPEQAGTAEAGDGKRRPAGAQAPGEGGVTPPSAPRPPGRRGDPSSERATAEADLARPGTSSSPGPDPRGEPRSPMPSGEPARPADPRAPSPLSEALRADRERLARRPPWPRSGSGEGGSGGEQERKRAKRRPGRSER
jgi:hypothetical protein